ncbi:MAG TPA: hypothetical protein VKZ79_02635 [Alphaproteobacteria bacterium]|nr:hypothetical protein [Alphaproteobacteria bacterium]
MAMKPNYNQQRAERNRQKRAKAEEKERERAAQVAKRRAQLAEPDQTNPDDTNGER